MNAPVRRLSSWSWCRHYNGTYGHETCNAGVRYEDVRDDSTHPYSWPCFQDHLGKIPCASQSFKTEEEIAAEEEAATRALREWVATLNAGGCPVCNEVIERREQVGVCVYASPCGHRLYQGEA